MVNHNIIFIICHNIIIEHDVNLYSNNYCFKILRRIIVIKFIDHYKTVKPKIEILNLNLIDNYIGFHSFLTQHNHVNYIILLEIIKKYNLI